MLVGMVPVWENYRQRRSRRKRKLSEEDDQLPCTSKFCSKPQTYSIATYDATFKWTLTDENIRLSFLHAFLPIINIKDSTRLGDSFDKFKNIRDLVHNKKNIEIIELLTNHAAYVTIPEGVGKNTG
jgi:hypothetical protein